MGYLISAIIFVIAVAVVILVAKNIASHTFKCKHCSGEFTIRWPKVMITEHSDSEYRLECPHCKTKDWCTQQPKNT